MHDTKGLEFTRIAIALALGDDKLDQSETIAKLRWGENSLAAKTMNLGGLDQLMVYKATVPAGSTGSGNWGETLVRFDGAAAEFFDLVRQRSLIGRIQGLRRVPLNTKMIGLATGFAGAWVAQGAAKTVGRATFDSSTLPVRKVSSLAVVTRDLLESSDPAAERLIRDDMIRALAETIDASFIDPANAGTADVEPASIAYGAPSEVTAGTSDMDDIRHSVSFMIANFDGDLERAVFIGRPELFAFVGLNSLGWSEQIGARGGTFGGIPAIPSKMLPLDAGGAQQLVLIDPDAVAIGEDGMEVRTSTQGTIEMNDAPTNSSVTPTATQQISLWQTNSVGILAESRINFELFRAGGVSVLTGLAGGLQS